MDSREWAYLGVLTSSWAILLVGDFLFSFAEFFTLATRSLLFGAIICAFYSEVLAIRYLQGRELPISFFKAFILGFFAFSWQFLVWVVKKMALEK